MRPKRLREAIEAVVHENDELLRILSEYKEEEPTNLTWAEGDRWYGCGHIIKARNVITLMILVTLLLWVYGKINGSEKQIMIN